MKTLYFVVIMAVSVSLLLGVQTPEAFSEHELCWDISSQSLTNKFCHQEDSSVTMSPQFYTDDKEINKAQVTLNNPAHGDPFTVTVTLDEPANGTIEFNVQVDDCHATHGNIKKSAINLCSNTNHATIGGSTTSDFEYHTVYNSETDRDATPPKDPIYLTLKTQKITINKDATSGTATWNTCTLCGPTSGESFLVMVSPIVQRTIDNPYLYDWIHPGTPRDTTYGSQSYWEAHLGRDVPTIRLIDASALSVVEGSQIGVIFAFNPTNTPSTLIRYSISQSGNFLDAVSPPGVYSTTATHGVPHYENTHDDSVPEDDGSVTFSLLPSSDYNLGTPHSLTFTVTDNDRGGDMLQSGVPIPDSPIPEIDPAVIDGARLMAEQTHLGADHVDRWNRVLAAFGVTQHDNPMTADEALANVSKYNNAFWQLVAAEIKKLETYFDTVSQQPQQQNATQNTPQQPQEIHVPQINHTSNIAQDTPIIVPESIPIPTADPELIEDIKYLASQVHHGHQHVDRWNRALAAFGVIQHDNPLTAAEAQANTKKYSSPLWVKIANILQEREAAIEQQQQQQQQKATQNTPQPPQEIHVPQINHTSNIAQDSPQVEPIEPTPEPPYTVNATLIEAVKEQAGLWNRTLAAFNITEHDNPMTTAEAQNNTQKYSNPLWAQIAETLKKLEAAN